MYIFNFKIKKNTKKREDNFFNIYDMKKCKYRNCENSFSEGRDDKIFCSVQCKRNEKKYRQRNKNKVKIDEKIDD